MLVNRSENQSGPATMSIYFRQTATGAGLVAAAAAARNMVPLAQQPHSSTTGECPAPAPEEGERVVTIDMKNRHSQAIYDEFMQKTGATVVAPTPDEQVEMQQIEELREKAAVDRAIMKKYIDDKRREERMLAQARQEAEAIRMANQ
ncbi:hypothetical protein DL764_001948 [Monosporascus ibericus]|uniref:Uncharacterized protein n=1 Tax=Monosporascus ibericus TaxID=155417 RepID=A0A4V1XC36_9PEZI|nr:hypothetical protein DL764_001948 [Monosporascus ibericus]